MPTEKKPLTVLEALQKTKDYFKQKDIVNPRLNAERLLSRVLNVDRVQLYLDFERLLSGEEVQLYREFVRRRGEQEPLQYIIGETEFMGMNFKIRSGSLIPRPETEILVEKTLELKTHIDKDDPVIWDIGTGSGCIAIAIASLWKKSQIIASDVSGTSLELSQENARSNGVVDRIKFVKHNILEDPPGELLEADLILSNPPYVSRVEFENLEKEIRSYEPRIALTDEEDGLGFYKKIFSLIENGARCKFILLEMSGTQTEEITRIAASLDLKEIRVFEDLNLIPRILRLQVK
jgi:release factor glutamine methyltransferase